MKFVFSNFEKEGMEILTKDTVFDTSIPTGSVIKISAYREDGEKFYYFGLVIDVKFDEVYYVRVNNNGYIVDRTISLKDVLNGEVEISLLIERGDNNAEY